MGNFVTDTAVTPRDRSGSYTAQLSSDWAIWGPAGGYAATVALRAAAAESRFARPANCAVHFLGVASFDEVQLEVEVVKATRRAESIRVLMHQGERPILQLICWAIGDEQLDRTHRFGRSPLPAVTDTPTVAERMAAAGLEPDGSGFRFWDNFEQRPLRWSDDWEARGLLDPEWRTWLRFGDVDPVEPPSEDIDPWVEAGRLLLLVDLGGWPAANVAYAPADGDEWYAPSLDVSCQFTDLDTTPWLGVEHISPVGADGLLNATGRVWSDDGRLLAAGVTQLLATPTRR